MRGDLLAGIDGSPCEGCDLLAGEAVIFTLWDVLPLQKGFVSVKMLLWGCKAFLFSMYVVRFLSFSPGFLLTCELGFNSFISTSALVLNPNEEKLSSALFFTAFLLQLVSLWWAAWHTDMLSTLSLSKGKWWISVTLLHPKRFFWLLHLALSTSSLPLSANLNIMIHLKHPLGTKA